MDEKVKQLKTYLRQYRTAATRDRTAEVRDLIENLFLDELDRNEIAEAEIERLREALEKIEYFNGGQVKQDNMIITDFTNFAKTVAREALKGGE